MKSKSTIALIGISALLAAAPALGAGETGPEALIGQARAVVTAPHFSRDEITKALVNTLDASLLILPSTGQPAETRSLIESARNVMDKGDLFSGPAYGDLGKAYASVAGGRAWKIPEELTAVGDSSKGIQLATKICVKLLDEALAAYKAGQNEEAVRDLLDMVLLVVTPIERVR